MSAPTRVTTPIPTVPTLYGLRLWLAETFGSQESAATLRWQHRNASQPAVCDCGAPGTVRVTDQWATMVVGSCKPYWWRCDEHASVPLTVPWSGGVPLLGGGREQCRWQSGPIGGPTTECECGTHVGERRR